MKNLIIVTLVFLITSAQAQNICHFVYRPNVGKIYSADFSKISRINRLDKFSAKFRRYISKQDEHIPSLINKYYDDFLTLEQELIKGDYYKTMNRYKMLYRKTQSHAIIVKDHTELANALRGFVFKSHGDDVVGYLVDKGVRKNLAMEYASKIVSQKSAIQSLKSVEKFSRKHFRRFGRRFDEYSTIDLSIQRLAKSADCSADCKQAVKYLYENIGFGSKAERAMYDSILNGRKGISYKELEKLFYSHPDSLLISARKKFYFEVGTFLKTKVKKIAFLDKLYEYFRISGVRRRSSLFMQLFKGHYDRIARNLHRPIYNKISYSDLGIPEKYDLMFKKIKKMDSELFWMDFSREAETQVKVTWQKLKKHAQTNDPSTYGLMMESEILGEKLGGIGAKDYRKMKRIVGALVAGGTAYTYFTFGKDKDPSSSLTPIDNNNNQVLVLDDPANNNIQITDADAGLVNGPLSQVSINELFGEDTDGEEVILRQDGHVLIEYDSEEDLEAQEILFDASLDLIEIERRMNAITNQGQR